MGPFQLTIYPHVVLANTHNSIGAALQSARRLEKVGHTISSINRGNEICASGETLRDLLGEKEVGTFKNFPTTNC